MTKEEICAATESGTTGVDGKTGVYKEVSMFPIRWVDFCTEFVYPYFAFCIIIELNKLGVELCSF